ncbi:MAG: hypothetical protein DRP63_03865, partial [Planctomycetota bacterium]
MAGRHITHPLLGGLGRELRRLGVRLRLCWRGRAGKADVAVAGLARSLKVSAAAIVYAPHPR